MFLSLQNESCRWHLLYHLSTSNAVGMTDLVTPDFNPEIIINAVGITDMSYQVFKNIFFIISHTKGFQYSNILFPESLFFMM